MNDSHQMLKAILNGQRALKETLVNRIEKVEKKVDTLDSKVDKLDRKLDSVEKNLTKRIDNLGKQLAYLEDDSPTRKEFNGLENRVNTLEEKSAATL